MDGHRSPPNWRAPSVLESGAVAFPPGAFYQMAGRCAGGRTMGLPSAQPKAF